MASEAHIKLMVVQESRPEDWSVQGLEDEGQDDVDSDRNG